MNTQSMMPEKVALPLSAGQTAKTQSLSRLPDVMLEEGAKRLGVAGILYSVTFFFAFFGTNIFAGNIGPNMFLDLRTLVAAASILLGLAIFALSRYGDLKIERMLNLGLVFLVVSTLGISMSQFWGIFQSWTEGSLGEYVGIPWECV